MGKAYEFFSISLISYMNIKSSNNKNMLMHRYKKKIGQFIKKINDFITDKILYFFKEYSFYVI